MLVQDRAALESPNAHIKTLPLHHPNRRRFADVRNLDFTTWLSDNVYRIGVFFFVVVTVAALFFIYNTTNTASLLCHQSQSTQTLQTLARPQINWNSIQILADKTSPYVNFQSEKWIVVSVTKYPTEELKSLVKIRGWQVLAVGNSMTPKDWSLKGTIFLSLDAQAELGFRILDHLPYDSYVRKSVGYLFAIQHGAKKIFDADDRGEVIDGDLGKHFDVELVSEDPAAGAGQVPILQYTHEDPNRTVVNPYIHFGQRSVWPRGLPLENVGEINHEEYYTEVFSGKQFIQQGTSNGLPDIDSFFYFTRKTNLESFDIRFDEHSPKVALPQGLMVPINSFNTLYHSSAFWALMLPVSVSSMASDVLRGYWGQRILWEIGGYVVVYPPTVHRYDKIEAYPFSEEKDLHVNVGRLIKFLLSWRSEKHNNLFEKILDLSFAMEKEGFWTEHDVRFTAAWLQDLVAVGYQQPQLMSLALDRPRANVEHGDKKEFVPRKLPSVHLAVSETGTVITEIGNLIRWRKNFGNVVLIMFCNGPVDRTALEWRLLYGRIFKTVVILSSQKNSDLYVEEARLENIYKHLPKIFERYSGAEGFLFLEDDTILNYWNLVQADKTKLWITDKVSKSWSTLKPAGNSEWYNVQTELVKRIVSTMPAHFQVNYKEAAKNSHESLIICSSEIFYVPKRYVADFVDLVGIVGDLNLHYKVAVPMFFVSMDSPQNFDPILSSMIYKRKMISSNSSSTLYSPQASAVHPWSISSEQDFIKLVRVMAEGDPLLMELV